MWVRGPCEVYIKYVEHCITTCKLHSELECLTYLRVVYIMDHEVVPRPFKICDWLLDSSRDHFGLHKGKMSKWPWSSGPQKTYFKAYIIHWHGPTNFCSGRGKRGALVEKSRGPRQRNVVKMKCQWMFFWGERENEDKKRQENDQTRFLFPFKISILGIY